MPDGDQVAEGQEEYYQQSPKDLGKLLKKLEKEMYGYAKNLEFEAAASVRDRINKIRSGQFLSG